RITFSRAPRRQMTEVRVEMQVGLRGHTSALLAKAFAKPELEGDLLRLKQVIETGEVLYSDATLHRLPHPAQPAAASRRDAAPEIFVANPPKAVKGVTP
ncbi:MAG TPA: hypothetical protein VK607_17185, partial [Kofleriaceae bacterium]|nr:hypothetical protein [Kofleriaceae bacterium]